jgi:acyl dehydratase
MSNGSAHFAALPVGRKVTVSKTVSETDLYLFAGITGDFSPNHVDEAHMRKTPYGRRIAHGALAVGFMSQASTKALVTVTYEVVERGEAARKAFSRVTVTTDRGSVVAAATHILKLVE